MKPDLNLHLPDDRIDCGYIIKCKQGVSDVSSRFDRSISGCRIFRHFLSLQFPIPLLRTHFANILLVNTSIFR